MKILTRDRGIHTPRTLNSTDFYSSKNTLLKESFTLVVGISTSNEYGLYTFNRYKERWSE